LSQVTELLGVWVRPLSERTVSASASTLTPVATPISLPGDAPH